MAKKTLKRFFKGYLWGAIIGFLTIVGIFLPIYRDAKRRIPNVIISECSVKELFNRVHLQFTVSNIRGGVACIDSILLKVIAISPKGERGLCFDTTFLVKLPPRMPPGEYQYKVPSKIDVNKFSRQGDFFIDGSKDLYWCFLYSKGRDPIDIYLPPKDLEQFTGMVIFSPNCKDKEYKAELIAKWSPIGMPKKRKEASFKIKEKFTPVGYPTVLPENG